MIPYMSPAVKQFYQREFLAEMEAHKDGDRFLLLPSQAAKIVGDRWSVDVATVLLAFAPTIGTDLPITANSVIQNPEA